MKRKIIRALGPLVGVALFVVALWVLHHELKAYRLSEIVRHLGELSSYRLALALMLTALSYLIMTGYDTLAVRYIQHPLPYRRIALASFIGYAFSNNMGLGMVAGGSIRYRLYSAWGFSLLEITQVVAFCSLSLWLGFLTVGGVVFLTEPLVIPKALHLPFPSVHPIGMIFIALVVAYIFWSVRRKTPLRMGGWEFRLPSVHLFLGQISIAVLDWALAGSVLYVLLPVSASLSYPGFLSVFLLAQVAGLVSQVPGGLGVFETVVILLLPPTVPTSVALGSLLAYRVMYYLFPLLVAAILLGTQELVQKKEAVQRIARIAGDWSSRVVPPFLAFTTFVGGAILLFSGATPATSWRLGWLKNFLPLPVLEISHFLGSLAGAGLLLLAWGLQRRIDIAYALTSALLGAGIVLSLLKGLDYEEAIVLSIMLAALLPCRRYFYRRASLTDQMLAPGWMAAIMIVLLCTIWLGLFSYKHVEYSNDLWWRFTFSGNAPRFLRAMVGAIGLLLFFAMTRLLRPATRKPTLPRQEEWERAISLVQRSHQTYANLALLRDKAFLFSQQGNALIMYNVEGRSWVAMGDPIGLVEEWPDLLWRYREMCDRYGGWTVFYEVSPGNVHLYLDLGLSLLKIGEQARVPLKTFSLEGGTHKGLRHTSHRLEKEGCVFEVIPADEVPSILSELKLISDAWLREKSTREKGFSLGFFSDDYLKCFPAGIVRKDRKIIAFANIWPGAEKEELSIDLMRYLPEAPHGVMEYLFVQLMLWGNREGYQWFNLGMAPFSGLQDHALAPLWNRVGAFIFRHGEHFYNFQGLRQYKEKFDPAWEPRYLASPGGFALPRIFANIASLVSGGLKGLVTK